jgi:hypothetical protein
MSDSASIVELADAVLELLGDQQRCRELTGMAQQLMSENRGATERTLRAINPLLATPATVAESASSFRAKSAPVA